jgi:hypothetical protein
LKEESRMITTLKKTLSAAALTALAVLVLPLGAEAQVEQQEAPPPPDREELVDFARAYIDVQEVQQEMEQALATVQDAEEANRIQEQANEQMAEAVEDHDLTVERYSQIVIVLNTDEELRQEFEQVYQELLEDRDGVLK